MKLQLSQNFLGFALESHPPLVHTTGVERELPRTTQTNDEHARLKGTKQMTLPINEIPSKAVDQMSDAELKATSLYLQLLAIPLMADLGEKTLLANVKRTYKKAQRGVGNRVLKPQIDALFSAADSRSGFWPGDQGDKLIVYRSGKVTISGKAATPAWTDEDHVKLVGTTITRTVGDRAAEDKQGDYRISWRPSLKTRQDVPFSLLMKQPDGTVRKFPAKKKGEPADNECDVLEDFVTESQAEANQALHLWAGKAIRKFQADNADDADDADENENDDVDIDDELSEE